MNPPRVGLVGLGGYGAVHLRHLQDFHRRGELALAAAVAFSPEDAGEAGRVLQAQGCAVFPDFTALVAALPGLQLDLVVLPTPIHLHARMTTALVRAGVHVLVEKPLAASRFDASLIATAARAEGRTVAVGFQYLHAPEVQALKRRLLDGALGPLKRLVVHAAWPRSHVYYTRNDWAGRLQVDGEWVLDSPVSNAMSHFLMVMLFLAGREERTVAVPARMGAELYRAQAIESFDTAVVRLETAEGVQLDFYGTHSSREIGRPSLQVFGETGEAEWVQDSHARLRGPGGSWKQAAAPEFDTRERMLRDVLSGMGNKGGFICSPEMAAVHVACVTELHRRAVIVPIPPTATADHQLDGQNFTYVPGLDEQLRRAAQTGTGLAAAGAAWAGPAPPLTALDS